MRWHPGIFPVNYRSILVQKTVQESSPIATFFSPFKSYGGLGMSAQIGSNLFLKTHAGQDWLASASELENRRMPGLKRIQGSEIWGFFLVWISVCLLLAWCECEWGLCLIACGGKCGKISRCFGCVSKHGQEFSQLS